MRKFLFLLIGLAILSSPMTALGQIIVGDVSCTTTCAGAPVDHYYGYTESQYIIPDTAIAAAGIVATDEFTDIGWYLCAGDVDAADHNIRVYLGELPAGAYPQVCSAPEAAGTLVYTGPLGDCSPTGCCSVTLDTTFIYNGGNLVVTVCDDQSGYSGSYSRGWAANADTGNGLYRHNDSSGPYDCDPTTNDYSGTDQCCDSWTTTCFILAGAAPTPTPTETPLPPTATPTFPPPAGDTCLDAVSIACGDCVTGYTVGAADDHDCGTGSTHEGVDVVYEFVLSSDATVTFVGEADYDADWTIATTCDATTGDILCADTSGTQADPTCGSITHNTYGYMNFTQFLAAGTYYIWVDGYGTTDAGNFALEITCDAGPTPTPTTAPVGGDCSNPIIVDEAALPFTETNATCGMGDAYADTCLGYYDGGEDILYQLNLTSDTGIMVTVDPQGTTYMGFSIDDSCPGDPTTCIAAYANGSLGTALTSDCISLTAGTYYIMIDTWPSPDCIPAFDITIETCVPPTPTITPTPDPLHACDPASIYSQPFVGETVVTTSDIDAGYVSADDFSGVTDPIVGITWWGGELENSAGWAACTRANDDYQISFWDDNAGVPGTVQAQETVTAIKVATSANVFGDPSYGPIYRYDATLATPVNMASGWISIESLSDGASCWFMWADGGTTAANDYVQDDGTGAWAPSGYGVDLSFCFTTSAVPTATPTGPTPTPAPLPATGPAGIGLLLLAIGGLLSLSGLRRK